MHLHEFPPLTKLVDEGITNAVKKEFEEYNARKGDRYPLSPSGIGKCGLKLARDLAHFAGVTQHPRLEGSRTPKLQRVFDRGHLLELALVDDFSKYTKLQLRQRQQRVHLFDVSQGESTQAIEGDVDGLVVCKERGVKILVDFKSKGAYYSAGFSDSISEFFESLKESGQVEEHKDAGHNCYIIKDAWELFQIIPLDEFFVDYLHQLNSYAFSDWFARTGVDFVALYYENKNTCQNYEVRWVPNRRLFEFAKKKFQYIYSTVLTKGPESVEREFVVGSARCRLCEYTELCNGKAPEKPYDKKSGVVDKRLEESYKKGLIQLKMMEKAEQEILLEMEKKGLTHIQTDGGIVYERKYLKSPKPHYELRLSK